jgi:hypothetical protein
LTRIIFALKYGAMKEIFLTVSIPKGGEKELVHKLGVTTGNRVNAVRVGNGEVRVQILGDVGNSRNAVMDIVKPFLVGEQAI